MRVEKLSEAGGVSVEGVDLSRKQSPAEARALAGVDVSKLERAFAATLRSGSPNGGLVVVRKGYLISRNLSEMLRSLWQTAQVALIGLALAMLIGVFTGTYSSIFVAAPVLVDMDKSGSLKVEEDRDARVEELKKMA